MMIDETLDGIRTRFVQPAALIILLAPSSEPRSWQRPYLSCSSLPPHIRQPFFSSLERASQIYSVWKPGNDYFVSASTTGCAGEQSEQKQCFGNISIEPDSSKEENC